MSDANASSGDTAGALPDDDVWGRHSAFMEANLRRNYTTNLTHGVFGMTGFRLIYAPTIIPAYLYLLTGSAAAVGLGTALLQLGGTVSPILSGAQVESRKRILPYAITVGSMMRVMVLVLAIAAWTLEGTALLVVTLASFLLLGFFSGAQRVAFQMLMAKLIPIDRRGRLQGIRNMVGGPPSRCANGSASSATCFATAISARSCGRMASPRSRASACPSGRSMSATGWASTAR